MPIFFIFGQSWLFFGQKMPKKAKIEQWFFCWIFFCCEAFTYQISEKFIKRFVICQYSSFFVNFGCCLTKKYKKMTKSKIVIFVVFYFVGKHLLTKFQKILLNDWILPIYFIFGQFWLLFYQKRPNSYKIDKKFYL